MPEILKQLIQVAADHAGERLDQRLSAVFPEYSRARLQLWIKQGAITVDGKKAKPGQRLTGTEIILVDVEISAPADSETVAGEPIDLNVIHEDQAVLVLNKPAGLVVHPAAGHARGTLQNALVHHNRELSVVPRCGIVHRLDKLTSGIMVVAKTLTAHHSLVDQLQQRSMSRRYVALVYGAMVSGGVVDAPIGRHPKDRKKMAVHPQGKPAVTHYRIRQRFKDFTLLDVQLETGRTHQIRVHMTHIHHPIVGDPVYGVRLRQPAGAGDVLRESLRSFGRQALHAGELSFRHPASGDPVTFRASWPEDLLNLSESVAGDPSQSELP